MFEAQALWYELRAEVKHLRLGVQIPNTEYE